MSTKNVLVVGAGVAGLTLAHWLARFGCTPTVVERARQLRRGGQAVDIRGVALDVAERTGVLDDARAAATDIVAMSYVDTHGAQVARLDGAFGVLHPGDVEILRGDLVRLLHERTTGVECLLGETVTALTETPDGVEVTFAGAPSRTFDLVVGADGLHSAVRELAFGPEELHHLGVGIATFTVPEVWGLDRTQRVFVEPGRVATVSDTRVDGEARAILLFAAPGTDFDHRDVTAQHDILAGIFANAGWDVPEILARGRAADDFYFDTCAQVRLGSWSAGRVVLAGDAAHAGSPLSGQGTSLALAGAYVLAGEIATRDDHRVAFSRYEALMRPFVRVNNDFALRMAKRVAPRTSRQVRGYLWSLRMMRHTPGKNLLIKLIARPVTRAANALALPEYPVLSPR